MDSSSPASAVVMRLSAAEASQAVTLHTAWAISARAIDTATLKIKRRSTGAYQLVHITKVLRRGDWAAVATGLHRRAGRADRGHVQPRRPRGEYPASELAMVITDPGALPRRRGLGMGA